jgi:hypothetical protein
LWQKPLRLWPAATGRAGITQHCAGVTPEALEAGLRMAARSSGLGTAAQRDTAQDRLETHMFERRWIRAGFEKHWPSLPSHSLFLKIQGFLTWL